MLAADSANKCCNESTNWSPGYLERTTEMTIPLPVAIFCQNESKTDKFPVLFLLLSISSADINLATS